MDFFNTVMGKEFYQKTMPEIARSLKAIATSLKEKEEEVVVAEVWPTYAVADVLAEERDKGSSFVSCTRLNDHEVVLAFKRKKKGKN